MFKKMLALLLFCHAAGHAAVAPPIGSQAALVVDSTSGRVLYEKNALNTLPIASITKVMTAMVVLDTKANLDQMIRIDAADVRNAGGTSSHLSAGSKLPLRSVLQLALMSSDNRAAAALARTYPGGASAFVSAVRTKCKTLGMTDTVIVEPTGLSAQNRATAADIARMAQAASRYPFIVRATSDTAENLKINGRNITYRNTNRLVGKDGWNILLSKTGTTRAAGRCVVMKLRGKSRNIIIVLLNAKDSSIRMDDAKKLHRYIDGWRRV